MIKKTSIISLCALSALLFVDPASAKKAKKEAAPEHTGGMMEDGEKDPAMTEGVDEDAQFVPGKKKKAKPDATGEGTADAEAHADSTTEVADKEPKKEEPSKDAKPVKAPKKTAGVFAEALIGFGHAPTPGPINPVTQEPTYGKSTTFGFLFGGHFDLTPEFRLLARIPWTTGTIPSDTPDKDTAANAFGNPELAARYRLTEPGDSEWAVRLGVGIPIAQGTPDPTATSDSGLAQGRLQATADAASGFHDPELYAVKRLPVTPSLQFVHRATKLRLNAELKAVIMPKLGNGAIQAPGDASTGGTLSTNGTALSAILGGSASYEVLSHVHLALAAWLAYVAIPQIGYDTAAVTPSPFQFVLEPRLFAQFGHVVPSAGFLIPLGGQLGGNINGVRIHVDVIF